MPREPKKPDEYIVHLMLESGHVVDMRLNTLEEVKGYAAKLKSKSEDEELLAMPMKNDNELLLVRPKRISAIHAEPIFTSSVDLF